MAKCTLRMDFKLKHVWLINLINVPLALFGFKGYIPKFCIEYGKSYIVEDK